MSLVILCLCSLVITFSTLHECHHFSYHCSPFHTHCCSSWRQPSCSTMLLHLPPYVMQWCCFFLLSFFPPWTLPLLMSLIPTSKASWLLFHYFLPPHFLQSTLHYSTLQYLKSIPHHCLLLLFFFSSIISGKMPKPPTLLAQPPFSPF